MKASELGLRGVALQVALDFELAHPQAVFTSGRRDLLEQAHAMAVNCVQDRRFIPSTYVQTAPIRQLQMAVDSQRFWTVDALAAAFLAELETFSDDELSHVSKHLSGDAFDVSRESCSDDACMWLACKAEEVGGKFLDHEGKLPRAHFQA